MRRWSYTKKTWLYSMWEKIKTHIKEIKSCPTVSCIILLEAHPYNTITHFFKDKTVFYGSVHPNNFKCQDCKARNVIGSDRFDAASKCLQSATEKLSLWCKYPDFYAKAAGSSNSLSLNLQIRKSITQRQTSCWIISIWSNGSMISYHYFADNYIVKLLTP